MTVAAPKRYAFRSAPVVIFGCLAAAIMGAELGGIALETAPRLFAGKPPYDSFQYKSIADWLYAMAFWNFFLVPVPLFGFTFLGWPALAAVRKRRPSWLGPKLIYSVGIVSGTTLLLIEFLAIILSGSIRNASLQMFLGALLSALVLGGGLGLPAAIIFRLIALRTQ